MLKHYLDNYPIRVGFVMLIIYGMIDFVDARVFIPKRVANYKTCEQSEVCKNWIIMKPNVSTSKERGNEHV